MDGRIFNAINRGNLDEVITMVDANPSILDAPDPEGRTPLIYACWKNQSEIADYVLTRDNRSIFIPDSHGSLPIHFACQSGNQSILDRLLSELSPEEIESQLMTVGANQLLPLEFSFENGTEEFIHRIYHLQPAAGIKTMDRNPEYFLCNPSWISMGLLLLEDQLSIDPFIAGKIASTIYRDSDRIIWKMVLQSNEVQILKLLRFVPQLFPTALFIAIVNRKSIMVQVLVSTQSPGWFRQIIYHRGYFSTTRYTILQAMIEYPEPEIFEILIPLYLETAMDPFLQGVLYFQIMTQETLRRLCGLNVHLFEMAMQLVYRIGGQPETIVERNIIVILMTVGNLENIGFLIWLGVKIDSTMYRLMILPPKCVTYLEAIGMIPESESMDESTQLEMRYQTYFQRSLTSKLLFFI